MTPPPPQLDYICGHFLHCYDYPCLGSNYWSIKSMPSSLPPAPPSMHAHTLQQVKRWHGGLHLTFCCLSPPPHLCLPLSPTPCPMLAGSRSASDWGTEHFGPPTAAWPGSRGGSSGWVPELGWELQCPFHHCYQARLRPQQAGDGASLS